ncbi:MAG: hypothetical protein OXI22_03000 [Defluviicoccus sp.]|nr:hypothetical protein [Defluviicoccus sp.]
MNDWTEVLRWLALAVGIAASIAGLAWTLGRIFRPWMRNEVRAGNDALYERLKNNDFRHVEERIERVDARMQEDVKAMEARIGERLDRARQDRRDMEARILAAVQRWRSDTDDSEA